MGQVDQSLDGLTKNANVNRVTMKPGAITVAEEGKEAKSKYIKLVSDEDLEKIDIAKIRKALPKEVFVKSVITSLTWMTWDMGVEEKLIKYQIRYGIVNVIEICLKSVFFVLY